MAFIEITLLVGAIIGQTVKSFFKKLVAWFKKDVYPELKNLFGSAVKGIKAFLSKAAPVADRLLQKIESYIYQAGSWLKRTVSRLISYTSHEQKISEDEIPDEIKEKIKLADKEDDIDITQELSIALA